MILDSPTRAQIEQVLATVPVARIASARTRDKKAARNVRRKDALTKFLEKNFSDPKVVEMILNDLDSYMGYEEEVDDPVDA
jgi:hypothetical protein